LSLEVFSEHVFRAVYSIYSVRMRTSSPSSKYPCQAIPINSVPCICSFSVFLNSPFDINPPVLNTKTVVVNSLFHGKESIKLRNVLFFHFLYLKVLLFLIVDGCNEIVDVVLLFGKVHIVILGISIDVNFFDHSIFV
jgi:hypothetical protein